MNDLHALAAGVICTGFDGTVLDRATESRLRDFPVAGIILFGRNAESVEQARELTDRLRTVLAEPILAIDQEGGRVARLRRGVEEIPSMMALAATRDAELAERAGAQIGFDLRRIGANLNFAPVLDLALQRLNTVIGARSFGDDPAAVALLAGAVALGMRKSGIVPTYKHFPGHGSTAVDSHLALPSIDLDEATLRARDLAPFERLLPEAEAVMTAHIVMRAFDTEHPATLSPRVLTTLLRDELRFAGLCFTDCLQMDAIASGVGTVEGALAALTAGADCLLVSHSIDLAQEAASGIARAVEDGRLPRARLENAHARVAALRRTLRPPHPVDAQPPFPGIGRLIGLRAVTAIRGDCAVKGPAIVLSFEGTTVEGVQGKHSDHPSLGAIAGVPAITLPLDPSPAEAAPAIARIARSGGRPVILARRAHVYPSQAAAIREAIHARPDSLLVSAREPFDAFAFPQAPNVACTYGDDAPSMQGLADVVFGGAEARGVLPIHEDSVART